MPKSQSQLITLIKLKLNLLYSCAAFIFMFIIGVYYVSLLDAADRAEHSERLREVASAQAFSIEQRLARSLSSTYILAQELKRSNGNFRDFEKYAGEVIQALGGITNLQLAPDGIIKKIHPLKGHERALGHNLLRDDARRKEAILAMRTQGLTLAGPFELLQGGKAVVGRNPVFLEKEGLAEGDTQKEDSVYFWGFASALIYLKDLLAVTELDSLVERGYSFQLSRDHPDTGDLDVFMRSEQELGESPVVEYMDVPNGRWYIHISRPYPQEYFLIVGNIVSAITAALFALLFNRILREPERLRIQVEEKTQELENLAFYDELTGLANRRFLGEQLDQEVKNLKRSGNRIAVMYLDLDDFKRVNDTMGHDVGDRLLQEIARRIRQSVRNSDIVARLGGDEFAVVLLNLSESDNVALIVENLIKNVRQPLQLDQRTIVISATVGITLAPDDSDNVGELFRNADLALFDSKRAGKNQFSFFNMKMQETATQDLLIEEKLRKAIDRKEFDLVYQPIFSLETNQLTSIEALIRWQHPEKGVLSPAEFIHVAESTGLIIPIGYWIIREACDFINHQQQQGNQPMPVAINISARQLTGEKFVEKVEKIIKDTGVKPELIELELTESMLMKDVELAIRLIRKMKKIGMRVSIDDFGTGYSSLSQLKKFPVDALKIDRSFVKDLYNNYSDRQIVEAITAMVHKLGLKVVAEGIESQEQLDFLKDIGCDYGQGYFFSKPITADDVLQFKSIAV